jgi:4-aminobutyrate aminotransferase/(S)-3-amino-2-methylpropionate transaminase
MLRKRLDAFKERYEIVGDVRGLGPMLALELVKERETKAPAADAANAVKNFALDKGLMLLTCGSLGNVIRLLMPLVITDEQLERGLAILEEGLASVSG